MGLLKILISIQSPVANVMPTALDLDVIQRETVVQMTIRVAFVIHVLELQGAPPLQRTIASLAKHGDHVQSIVLT